MGVITFLGISIISQSGRLYLTCSLISKNSKMPATVLIAALLTMRTVSTAASPIQQLHERVGGPTTKAILSNCTITDPVAALTLVSPSSTARYRPAYSTSSSQIYAYYLQPDSAQVTRSNSSALFTKCLQACYGYGNTSACVSAYMTYNVPDPPDFGAAGSSPAVACVMYSRILRTGEFEAVPETPAGYGNATAGDISCPPSTQSSKLRARSGVRTLRRHSKDKG